MPNYAVLGAGMQGTAAAYDLGRFGQAEFITLADLSLAAATASADRVNGLLGRNVCRPRALDAADVDEVAAALRGHHVALSCVPYPLHAGVERAAIEAGVSAVDMGNDTDVTLETLAQDGAAQAAGVTVVPDTGLAPGLVNNMATAAMARLDRTTAVRLYCGGLPQKPRPPFGYSLRFSMEGLIGEYVDEAIALRGGEVLRLPTLEEIEAVEVEGLGTLEAATTSSGTSTAPYTFASEIESYEYKTLRYPGHWHLMRVFRDCGLFGFDPVDAGGVPVVPARFFAQLMEPVLTHPEGRDLVVALAVVEGEKGGRPAQVRVELTDCHDEATGFTAMERMTGFSTSIMAIAVANTEVRKGCVPYELALPGQLVLDRLADRGIKAKVTESP